MTETKPLTLRDSIDSNGKVDVKKFKSILTSIRIESHRNFLNILDEILTKRREELREKVDKSQANLKEVRNLGGHSCYGHAYEEALIAAYKDELEFLEILI